MLSVPEEEKRYDLSYTSLAPSSKLNNETIHFFPGETIVNISPSEKWKARKEKAPQTLNVLIHTPNIYYNSYYRPDTMVGPSLLKLAEENWQ